MEEKRKYKQIKTLLLTSFTENVLIYIPNKMTVLPISEVM